VQIVPVIDIREGVAVRAVAGERAFYQPVATPISASADPVDLARGYRAVFPFATLYVADLDGIEGRGGDRAQHRRIADAWDSGEVWLDAGSLVAPSYHPRLRAVIGSETLLAAGVCRAPPFGPPIDASAILSLDFRGSAFLGPPELLADPSAWPGTVIVMTLASVGRGAGPDLKRVASIAALAGAQRRVFAAGGVRDMDDARALAAAGASGVLVATALHEGKIKTGDLERPPA